MIKTNYSNFFPPVNILINALIVNWLKRNLICGPIKTENHSWKKKKNTIPTIYLILNLDFEDNIPVEIDKESAYSSSLIIPDIFEKLMFRFQYLRVLQRIQGSQICFPRLDMELRQQKLSWEQRSLLSWSKKV